MQIIPAINEDDFSQIKNKLNIISSFSHWVQIDIADGKFTSHKTWNNPQELSDVRGQPRRKGSGLRPQASEMSDVNIELHLMVENSENAIDDWLKIGVKRIIVHFEAIKNSAAKNPDNDESDILNFILAKCEANGVELGLAINPETSAEELMPHLDKIRFIQILAVNPGSAGQKFQKETLEKIKFLKSLNFNGYANTIVEVDGGINLEIAKMCKEAGADILAAASYIWNSENPKTAFEELGRI